MKILRPEWALSGVNPIVKDLAVSIAGANIERFSESAKLFI